MKIPRWLLLVGIVLWFTALAQSIDHATSTDPQQKSLLIGLIQSAANQHDSKVIPDITLSLRDINDEYVTSVVIGSPVQLVLTIKTSPAAQLPSNTMVLPWSCRAVSQHTDSPEERYILQDGCGDGDVISADSGFLYSPWWQAAESTKTARSEFFRIFGLGTRGTLRFECELLTATDYLKDKSCVKSESKRMYNQRRMKRRVRSGLPTAHTLPITMLPHTPGTMVEENPYLQNNYYPEGFNVASTTIPTPRTTILTTPTTSSTTTTMTTPQPTTTTTTASTTTPTTTTTAKPVLKEPDAHAAQSSQDFMATIVNSPLVMGLLVGLGVLMFILLIVAIPTAFLCCRVLRTSMEKDPGAYPYPMYAPIPDVRYGYEQGQPGMMALFQSPIRAGQVPYQPVGLQNGVQVLPVENEQQQRNAQPAEAQAQTANVIPA